PAAFERYRASIGRVHAEERQRKLGSTRTEQSSEAQDLSGAQLKAQIVIVPISAKGLDFEHNRACGETARLHLILESLPCHQMAEFAVVDRRCSKGADLHAVPQHRHALGDLKHLVESVAHEYDADAGTFQVADELD